MNFINSIANNSIFAFFLRIFDEFFSGFRAKFQKIVTCAAFSIKFARTNQKFAENSEFCEKKSLLLVNYSLHSLARTPESLSKEAGAQCETFLSKIVVAGSRHQPDLLKKGRTIRSKKKIALKKEDCA